MPGWVVPPPREPVKSRTELERERREKVRWLVAQGLLRSERIMAAMLRVPREAFIPLLYRDYAYQEVPLPLPGVNATISCPHGYPLFYEALGLDEGHRFLEVGLGSGYGAALAREVVGDQGLVVSLEIDPVTFAFARQNLEDTGYRDIVLVNGDGGLGWPVRAPYDRVCVTAACPAVPPPLVEQLAPGGRLALPVLTKRGQDLVILEKGEEGIRSRVICQVLYVSLQGKYGEGEKTEGRPEERPTHRKEEDRR